MDGAGGTAENMQPAVQVDCMDKHVGHTLAIGYSQRFTAVCQLFAAVCRSCLPAVCKEYMTAKNGFIAVIVAYLWS